MNCECDRKWMNIGIIENSEICEEWEKSWNAMKWRYCDDHTGIYRLLIRSIWIWSNLFFWKFLFIYIILSDTILSEIRKSSITYKYIYKY